MRRRKGIQYKRPLDRSSLLEWVAFSCLLSACLFMLFASVSVAFGAQAPGTLRMKSGFPLWLPYLAGILPVSAIVAFFLAPPRNPTKYCRRPRVYRAKVSFDFRHFFSSLPTVFALSVLMVPFVLFSFCIMLLFAGVYLGPGTIWSIGLIATFGFSLYAISLQHKVRLQKPKADKQLDRRALKRPRTSLFRISLADMVIVVFQAGFFGAVLYAGFFDSIFGRSFFARNLGALLGLQIAHLCIGLLFANEVRAEGERRSWPASHRAILLSLFLLVFAPLLLLSGYAYGFGPYSVILLTGEALIFWFVWHSISSTIGKSPMPGGLRARLPIHSVVHPHRGSGRHTSSIPQPR